MLNPWRRILPSGTEIPWGIDHQQGMHFALQSPVRREGP